MKAAPQVQMLIVPTTRPKSDVIGLQAVRDRLEQVHRLPFESLKAMAHRALWMVKGDGPLLLYPLLRD